MCIAVHLIWKAVHEGLNVFFPKSSMDENKINKNLKNVPKHPVSWYVINKGDKPDLRDCFEKAAKYCFGSET